VSIHQTPAAAPARLTEEATLALLTNRMAERGDMPGFSKSVQALKEAMMDGPQQDFDLAQAVLADVSLTQKVLRLANSAMYAAFGGEVNTVSKAVFVLGTETVGHLALGLKVLDQLKLASPESQAAQGEMSKAVLAAQLARACAGGIAGVHEAEAAAICAMLHGLGQILVSFYMPEHWAMLSDGDEPGQRAQTLEWLGASLETLGRRTAQRWGLPASITRTIDEPDLAVAALPLSHEQWLTALAAFSTEAASGLATQQPDTFLTELALQYSASLGADPLQLAECVRVAHRQAQCDGGLTAEPVASDRPAVGGKPANALVRLQQSVLDLREAAKSSSTGQLISLALESLHQNFGFTHSFAFARVVEPHQFLPRIGFGPEAKVLMPSLAFAAAYEPHVFHAALSRDVAIYIDDAQAPALADKIPHGWRTTMTGARSFLLVPLTVQGRPFGLLVGAWDRHADVSRVTAEEMAPVNEMRQVLGTAALQRRVLAESGKNAA
jgi:HD-like signal output (HDOD) protein